jgi:hypothetical protein
VRRSTPMSALALGALLCAAPAAAQVASPRWGSAELGGGPYLPRADHEFGGGVQPWHQVFGGAPAPMWRLHLARAVYAGDGGSVEVGFKTGYFTQSGHAVDRTTGKRTADRATFNIIPTSLTLTYRADQLWEGWGFPLVPYARVALERYNWWTTKQSKWTQRGATNGFSATGGVALVIDYLDPQSARDLDNDVGVNHTALYFDVTKSKVDDFGSKRSWDLSDNRLFWSTGLLLVF